MSDSTSPSDQVTILVKNTTKELKDIERSKIKTRIKNVLQEFPLANGKVKFNPSDSSHKLRCRYAVTFWKEKTSNESIISKKDADDLIDDLKEELNSKECIYPEAEDEETDDVKDTSVFTETPTKAKSARKQSSVWYVTCKCENKFYVKSTDRNEIDVEIDRKEIESCVSVYGLIFPGDEVQLEGKGTLSAITKSTGLTSVEAFDAQAKFIQDLSSCLSSGETSALTVCDILCERYKGIWNHIINDNDLVKNIQCITDILQLSSLLAEKLSKSGETRCETFLEGLSSSSFFIASLPGYIQRYASGLNCEEINSLKSLLKLMMQFTPQTGTKVLEVAEYLANAMENTATCSGVKYLVHLGKILAKSVPGYQDVDTSNCKWNELRTIPTEKEILSEFHLDSLSGIRRDKPYDSIEQYLEINYKLLREECFRNLCAAIQDFLMENSFDPRKMKMYRITLNTVYCDDSQVFLVLNCEDYYKNQGKESDEIEDTSNQILYGSLMCISLNKKFDSFIWATVVDFKMQQDSNKKDIYVRLCSDRNKTKDIKILLKLLELTNEGDHALMAESATFFPAFGPSMDRLKEMNENSDMPLVDELVFGKNSSPPDYTHDKDRTCDWSIIFKLPPGCQSTIPQDQPRSPIQQYEYLKDKTETSQRLLDETQMMGVKNFLENRVSLIQGPPGTGKSFLGAKILRLMLSMEIHKRYGGPILVMTYKNSALDHFLEACLPYNPKIVRIGKAGKDKLAKINLRNVRKGKVISKQLLSDRKATEEMKRSRFKLKSLFKYLSNPVFTLQSFFQAASEYHIRSLLTMSTDVDQNINNKALVDDLLSKWKENNLTTQLKELVKESLNKWLPAKEKLEERFCCYGRKGHVPGHKTSSVSTSTEKKEEECLEDAIDKAVVAQERQKDALEEDYMEEKESGKVMEDEVSGYTDEPLTKDIIIPFLYKNDKDSEKDVDEELNLWELSDNERLNFIRALQSKLIREFSNAVTLYEKSAKKHQEVHNEHTVKILKEFDVIGMTITGAATRLHLLNELKPCAVIVEEAAEIIEGQLVSVLPPTIKHLVMLGDQEQLKPRISCYDLKRKKNLDCSMFERLISNKLLYQQLGRQCRMHKDVVEVLRSLDIYKNLTTNEEETCNKNPPECIGRSLYFVKHTGPEGQILGSKSIWNQHEINYILDVAVYLMKYKYSASKVTVLCPYRGQVDKMKTAFKKKSKETSEKYFKELEKINITTVDSFQGEENDVILLSLVRSNKEEKIGFFSERNRICVAVSRAKCALYMFGNVTVYSRSRDWKRIIKLLEEKRLVGKKFPFKDDPDGGSQITGNKDPSIRVTTEDINCIAVDIAGVWRALGRALGLSENVIISVDNDFKFEYEKCYQILLNWTQIKASQANFGALSIGFAHPAVNRHDLIEKYC